MTQEEVFGFLNSNAEAMRELLATAIPRLTSGLTASTAEPPRRLTGQRPHGLDELGHGVIREVGERTGHHAQHDRRDQRDGQRDRSASRHVHRRATELDRLVAVTAAAKYIATMIRRYRKAEIAADTIATTASAQCSRSAAAWMTPNFAMNPAVNGVPAWASRNTVNSSAMPGRDLTEAPVVVERVQSVAGAADDRDDAEAADRHHRVAERGRTSAADVPRADAASTPTRMNPAWLIELYASIRLTLVCPPP